MVHQNRNSGKVNMRICFLYVVIVLFFCSDVAAQKKEEVFRVLAFYTAQQDPAHISFVHEANNWFRDRAAENNFIYDSTNDWTRLNKESLRKYKVILFLDTRPERPEQRAAFQQYMEKGGGWMGFHFAAFALTPSAFNEDWDWYHNHFLGSGQYVSNTWRPTPAKLRVEQTHPSTKGLPDVFVSPPNEWYKWEKDLRKNPEINILLSIDAGSFPLGTGPKPHEIWHNGYYPVAWTNKRYRMVYINMGHNDMDYEHGTGQTLSQTFESKEQAQFILNTLLWLGKHKQ